MAAGSAVRVSAAGTPPVRHTVAYLVVAVLLALSSLSGAAVGAWQWIALAVVVAVGVVGVLRRLEQPLLLPIVGVAGVLAGLDGFLEVGLFSLALRRRDRTTVVVVVAAVVGILVQVLAFRRGSVDDLAAQAPLLGVLSWVALGAIQVVLPVVAGGWLGSHRDLVASLQERAAAAEAERELRAQQAVLRERERIAREMHDSLGHKLALVTMHAGALEVNAGLPQEGVRAQAELIRTVARRALSDLRALVGALGATEGDVRAPQPGLVDVAALVEASRAAGCQVEFIDTVSDRDRLPEAAGRAVHRVVQECLTNAHRHAPGEPVSVTIAGAPGQGIVVTAGNPLPREPQPAGSGTGLAGIGERIRLLGGTLSVGAGDGRFVVRADLPWPKAEES